MIGQPEPWNELATWEGEGGAPASQRCDYGNCHKTARVMLITLDHDEDRIAERRPMCRQHADEYVNSHGLRMLKWEHPAEMVIGRLR